MTVHRCFIHHVGLLLLLLLTASGPGLRERLRLGLLRIFVGGHFSLLRTPGTTGCSRCSHFGVNLKKAQQSFRSPGYKELMMHHINPVSVCVEGGGS